MLERRKERKLYSRLELGSVRVSHWLTGTRLSCVCAHVCLSVFVQLTPTTKVLKIVLPGVPGVCYGDGGCGGGGGGGDEGW